MLAGKPIWSTIDLNGPDGLPYKHLHRLSGPDALLSLATAENGAVLLDEVTTLLSSRGTVDLPPEVVDTIVQLRKRNVELLWTTPTPARCDIVLREVTQVLVVSEAVIARGSGWSRSPIVQRVTTLDVRMGDPTKDLLESPGLMERKIVDREFVWWNRRRFAKLPYVTGNFVFKATEVTHGRCLICGGQRKIHACKGHDRPNLEVIKSPPGWFLEPPQVG